MENNIETVVKIINQIGKFEINFDAHLNEFLLQRNVEINSSKSQIDNMVIELDELIISQVDLKIDDKMFQNLITIVISLIDNLKSNYNVLRIFYDFDNIPNYIITNLKIIDYKISKLLELKSKFEFGEKFSEYLGQSKQNKIAIPEIQSSKHRVSTRYELLNELGLAKIITSLKCSQGYKNRILSIIMEINIDTAKNLINGTYKGSVPADEQKIIDDILKNIK